MKLTEDMRVDAQSVGMLKDKETDKFVDYFFIANMWSKDPRYESRHMQAGEEPDLRRQRGKFSKSIVQTVNGLMEHSMRRAECIRTTRIIRSKPMPTIDINTYNRQPRADTEYNLGSEKRE